MILHVQFLVQDFVDSLPASMVLATSGCNLGPTRIFSSVKIQKIVLR
jgi:hypothetical protein